MSATSATSALTPLTDLLALADLSVERMTALLDSAQGHLDAGPDAPVHRDVLAGRIVATVFLEPSTRTRCSFAVAAHRLGADVVDLPGSTSSATKGETLIDTALTIEAMGVDAIVLRCGEVGGARAVADAVGCPVLNAGDGRGEHPTQGLLDLLTLRQALGDLSGRRIAIVGDIANSRVARSSSCGLTALGAEVQFICPPALAPGTVDDLVCGRGRVSVGHDLDAVLGEVDAIMMLRVQFERGAEIGEDYRVRYALTADRAQRLRPGAPVLHPGPMNRGLEIDDAVADDPQRSVIRRQVTNGVAVRMAALRAVLGH